MSPAKAVLSIASLLLILGPAPAGAQSRSQLALRDVEFGARALKKSCRDLIRAKKIKFDRVVKEARTEARRAKDEADHYRALLILLAGLRDGHAAVRCAGEYPRGVFEKTVGPGMFWCEAKGRVFVRNAWGASKAAGVRPGHRVLTVDGKPVNAWVEAREKELSRLRSFSTDHHARFYTLQRGLAAPAGTRMKLALASPKGRRSKKTVTFGRDHAVPFGPAVPPQGLTWAGKNIAHGETAGGFGYLHVRRCRREIVDELDQALAKLLPRAGLILDFRGNSGGSMDLHAFMGRFIPEGKQLTFASKIDGAGPKRFGGPAVVIINATCASAGETTSGSFKEEGRGYVIGESPTAGMSAVKETLELPSKQFSLYVAVRSNKSWFNDRKGLEGIGVIPHETVALDPKDLWQGRDTLIERAEALLRKFPQKAVPYDPRRFGWTPPKK